MWTEALRKSQGCKIEDDGTFFIPFESYLIEYVWTSIAVDMDKSYKRSNFMHKFTDDESVAYFGFELKKRVNTKDLDLAFSVSQQGDKLGKYRLREGTF